MDILAVAGSLRRGSYNLQLAQEAGRVVARTHPDVGFSILDWADVPLLDEDAEHPAPAAVKRVRKAVRDADGVWLFSPEYNHAIPGGLKNLLDWLSRPGDAGEPPVLAGKPVALAGASIGSSGATHAQDQLVGVLSFLDARIMNKPRLSIAHVGTQAEDGALSLSASAPYLKAQADAFVRFVERARCH
ncbi:NADPH-dependent FMN reductase [Rubneribacter sp.]